ncbi:uncharacterized protein EI90DRAFT_3067168, partial [Cantharellus anzutake]|uniref:uncharacterized protein n=1 Tax=Cantharellus anzutake TaxID=1750568 RepID=UPI001905B23C
MLPTGSYPAWCDNIVLISVLGDPYIRALASPPPTPSTGSIPLITPTDSDPSSRFSHSDANLAIPHRRTLGFSPGARYIGAFAGHSAFIPVLGLWILLPSPSLVHTAFLILYPLDPPFPRQTLHSIPQMWDTTQMSPGSGTHFTASPECAHSFVRS